MKNRWMVPLLFLSLGLNLGLLFMRFSPPDRPPLPPPELDHLLSGHLSRMTTDLELSDGQRDKLKVIYDKLFPDILESETRVRDLRKNIASTYEAPQIDTTELKKLLERLNAAHGRIDSLIAETILQEASILTSEQRKRYLKLMPWKRSGEAAGHRPQRRPPHDEKPPPP